MTTVRATNHLFNACINSSFMLYDYKILISYNHIEVFIAVITTAVEFDIDRLLELILIVWNKIHIGTLISFYIITMRANRRLLKIICVLVVLFVLSLFLLFHSLMIYTWNKNLHIMHLMLLCLTLFFQGRRNNIDMATLTRSYFLNEFVDVYWKSFESVVICFTECIKYWFISLNRIFTKSTKCCGSSIIISNIRKVFAYKWSWCLTS